MKPKVFSYTVKAAQSFRNALKRADGALYNESGSKRNENRPGFAPCRYE